jgi:lysozyme family protein
MLANYPESVTRVLKHEGGYTNHPKDPGGPTNWGITIHDARKYWKPGATAADVKAMPLSVAKSIYKARYWDAQKSDALEGGVDYCMFDYGVNSGIGRSGKVLRRLLGMPDNTSIVTPEVVAAANKKDAAQLAAAMCDERMRFLQSLKTFPTFGPGWTRRVKEVKSVSTAMARVAVGEAVPIPEPTPTVTEGRAEVPQPKVEGPVVAGGTATAGVAGTGFWDWIVAHPGTTTVVVVSVVFVTVLVVVKIKHHYRKKQEAPPPGWTPPVIADRALAPA